jgi:hypothetical protein
MFNNKVQEIAGAYLNLLLFESTVNLGTTGLSDSQLECWSLEISDARQRQAIRSISDDDQHV